MSRNVLTSLFTIGIIGTLVVGGAYAFNSLAPSPTATPTLTSTPTPTNTATIQPTHTPTLTPTNTATPQPTATLAPTATRANTATFTPIPLPTLTPTPKVLTASINGCAVSDPKNLRIEVVGLPANAKAGDVVKLPSGYEAVLQSASADGHGWITNVNAEVIKTNCPPTPKPSTSNNSSGGGSSGTGASGTTPPSPPAQPTEEPNT